MVLSTFVLAELGIRSFQKNIPFFAFFSALLKRTERSFPFFKKQWNILCVLFCSFKKNGTFFWVFISRQNLEKRMERNGKERNVPNGKEQSAQPCVLVQIRAV